MATVLCVLYDDPVDGYPRRMFDGRPIRDEYLIVDGGKLAGAGAHSYSAGDDTGGSEEAARSAAN